MDRHESNPKGDGTQSQAKLPDGNLRCDFFFPSTVIWAVLSSLAVNFNCFIIYGTRGGANLGVIRFSLKADLRGKSQVKAHWLLGLPVRVWLLSPPSQGRNFRGGEDKY